MKDPRVAAFGRVKRPSTSVRCTRGNTASICAACAAVALGWWVAPPQAFAVGYRLPNQDPEAIARGNAFVATADNPSAIYYNPAGITQLRGHNVQAGLYLLNANIEAESTAGIETENETGVQPVPQLYYTYTPQDLPFSLGLGLYFPYGLALEWPDDSPFRTLAIKGKLTYACVNPVLAWRVHPTLSVAAGPTLNLGEVSFTQGIGLSPTDRLKFEGNAFGAGLNAGILWQPHERWSFGAQYRLATSLDFEGDSEAYPYFPSTSSSAEMRFPQFAVIGVSYRPTPKWNLEFNLDWADWDYVNEIVFRGTSLGDLKFPVNMTSSFMYEFGVSRFFEKGWWVSGGYFYSENSIPDATFNPILPDAPLHLGSVGFGRHGHRWDWTVAYHFALGHRTVENNVVSPLADGTYDFFNQALTASLRFRF